MTQADRVHSTPPTNTSANNLPGPVDPTRRRLLTVAAGGAVAAVAGIPTAAQASPADPIYAAIEAHRNAHIAHLAAIKELGRFEEDGDSDHDWITEKPCHEAFHTFEAFVVEPAITPQGLVAKLAYLQHLASEFETEWMIEECVVPLDLINSFAASLENIGVQP